MFSGANGPATCKYRQGAETRNPKPETRTQIPNPKPKPETVQSRLTAQVHTVDYEPHIKRQLTRTKSTLRPYVVTLPSRIGGSETFVAHRVGCTWTVPGPGRMCARKRGTPRIRQDAFLEEKLQYPTGANTLNKYASG